MTDAAKRTPPGYFDYDRSDVLALVPEGVTRVLSIGCGAGRNEAVLKQRGAYVAGFEMNEEAAARARERLDEVVVGDVERTELPWPDGSFDCVICADVLEHLRDPETLLAKIRRVLTADGRVVVSVPNGRNWKILRELLCRGDFPYSERGLFDRTHLRIFTVKSTDRMLAESDYEVVRREFTWLYPRRLAILFKGLAKLSKAFREMMVFHYLVVARKSPAPGRSGR